MQDPPNAAPSGPRVLAVDLGALARGASGAVCRGPWSAQDPSLMRLGELSGSALGLALCALEPQDPPFVLCVGSAVRRGLPTAARATVLGRAPLTGRLAEGHVGSDLGRRLARVTDALVLRGRAPGRGSVLELDARGEVRLHVFPELEELSPGAMAGRLAERLGPCASLRSGRAGRRGVRFANLAAGGELPKFVGRGGLGAAFGDLGLVAVAVTAAPVEAEPLPELERALRASPRLAARARGGTLELAEALAVRGELLDAGGAPLSPASGRALAAEGRAARREHHGCVGCPTPCGWVFEGPQGRQGARFSAVHALGTRLGLNDLAGPLRLLAACDRLGLDAKEAGAVLAIFGRGLGDAQALEQILEDLVEGRGDAAELAQGAAAYAARHGLAFSGTRGEDLRPAASPVERLSRIAGARGAEPMRTFPFLLERPEALPPGLRDVESAEGRALLVAWHEDLVLALDALGFCAFSAAGLLADGAASLDQLAGWTAGLTAGQLLERGGELARLHHRLAEAAGHGLGGEPVEAELAPALAAYLRLRGSSADPSPAVAPESLPEPRPEPRSAPRPGTVLLRGYGTLARALGEELRLELDLPLPLEDLLREVARQRPGTRTLLLAEGRILPAVHRAGRRLRGSELVRDGEVLDLVLAIAGG